MLNLRDLIFSQTESVSNSQDQLIEFGTNDPLTQHSQSFSQQLQSPPPLELLESTQGYEENNEKASRKRNLKVFYEQKPLNNFKRRVHGKPYIPPLYSGAPEMSIDLGDPPRQFLPGLANFLYFPQTNRAEEGILRRNLVKAAYRECLNAGDVPGAIQALEAMLQLSYISIVEISELVNMIRSQSNYSPNSDSEPGVADNLQNSQLTMLKRLCEIILRQKQNIIRDVSNSVRSAVLMLFANVYVEDGYVEEAWHLLSDHTGDTCFATNDELHFLLGSVSVARIVRIAHILDSVAVDKSKASSKTDKYSDCEYKNLPSPSAVGQDPLLFSGIVKFVTSPKAGLLYTRAMKSGKTISLKTGGAGRRQSTAPAMMLRGVVSDAISLLMKIVKRDRKWRYLQLHEYLIAAWAGTSRYHQAFNHLKLLISKVRSRYASLTATDSYSYSLSQTPISYQQTPQQTSTFTPSTPRDQRDATDAETMQRKADLSRLWKCYAKFIIRFSEIDMSDLLHRQMTFATDVNVNVNSVSSACRSPVPSSQPQLQVASPDKILSQQKHNNQDTKGLHLLRSLRQHLLFGECGNIESYSIALALFALGQLSKDTFLEMLMTSIDSLPMHRYSYEYQPELLPMWHRNPHGQVPETPIVPELESQQQLLYSKQLWKSLIGLLGNLTLAVDDHTLHENCEVNDILFLNQQPTTIIDDTTVMESSNYLLSSRIWWGRYLFDISTLGPFDGTLIALDAKRALQHPLFEEYCSVHSVSPHESSTSLSLFENTTTKLIKRGMQLHDRVGSEGLMDRHLLQMVTVSSTPNEQHRSHADDDNISVLLESDDDEDDDDSAIDDDAEDDDNDIADDDSSTSYSAAASQEYVETQEESRHSDTMSNQFSEATLCDVLIHLLEGILGDKHGIGKKYLTDLFGECNSSTVSVSSGIKNVISDIHRRENPDSTVTELNRDGIATVCKRYYPVFNESDNWRRSFPPSWIAANATRRNNNNITIDLPGHVFLQLDVDSLELLTYKIIACAHWNCSRGCGQDSLYVARGVQIVIMHAILDLHNLERKPISAEVTGAGIRCLFWLVSHQINIIRAVGIASLAVSRQTETSAPPAQGYKLSSATPVIVNHPDTTMYEVT